MEFKKETTSIALAFNHGRLYTEGSQGKIQSDGQTGGLGALVDVKCQYLRLFNICRSQCFQLNLP